MKTNTQTQQLMFFRFKTPENALGWLIVATDILEALRLFSEAHPNNKNYIVSVENKKQDKRINLN